MSAPRDAGDADPDSGEPAPPSAPPPPAAPSASPAAPAPPPARPAHAGALFGTPALKRASGGDGHPGPAAALAVPAGESGDGSAGPAPGAPAEHVGPALGLVTDAWPRFVAAVRAEVGVRVGAVVGTGRPLRVGRGAVEVGLVDAFACRVADEHAMALHDVLAGVLGGEAPPVRYVVAPAEAGETAAPADPFERLKQLRQEHPVVRALFERFGAEIVWQ